MDLYHTLLVMELLPSTEGASPLNPLLASYIVGSFLFNIVYSYTYSSILVQYYTHNENHVKRGFKGEAPLFDMSHAHNLIAVVSTHSLTFHTLEDTLG
jgi:hypothetical protein